MIACGQLERVWRCLQQTPCDIRVRFVGCCVEQTTPLRAIQRSALTIWCNYKYLFFPPNLGEFYEFLWRFILSDVVGDDDGNE